MMLSRIKNKLLRISNRLLDDGVKEEPLLERSIISKGITSFLKSDLSDLKQNTIEYILKMKTGDFMYKYSLSNSKASIYGSVYACLLFGLFDEKLREEQRQQWAEYFDSFQSPYDGFFYDDTILNDSYTKIDWWGARHLCPHISYAYTVLGKKPKYEYKWVAEYYNLDFMKCWLDTVDWNSAIPDENDVDNKIMNVGCTLQYQRDFWNDEQASVALDYMKSYLKSKISKNTGFWGGYDVENPYELARMIQFSYHLMRIFFYDGDDFDNKELMIDLILKSQNKYGGFGVNLNSSACEDIDAVDPLIYLAKRVDYRKNDITIALQRALVFILSNQNTDGGYVFKRDMPFCYGSTEMSSNKNESAMFPTWFRTLSVAYIFEYLEMGNFHFIKCPGY